MTMHDEQSDQSSDFRHEGFQSGLGEPGEKNRGTAIKEKARQAKDRVLSKGSEAVHEARERTRSFADDRKSQLGERIHGYGSAIRRAAEKLRDEKDPNIAYYAESIAERVDQAADYVQSRDPGMILRDVENVARRRPEIFFGGMFLAGLVLARFLKASNQRDDTYQEEPDQDYWVEDESYDQASDSQQSDPNFSMTSGEAAGDWKQPGGTI